MRGHAFERCLNCLVCGSCLNSARAHAAQVILVMATRAKPTAACRLPSHCVLCCLPWHAEQAKILDSDREVVGLHKQRYVFPLIIHVSKISGAAADSIFLGVVKVCVFVFAVCCTCLLLRVARAVCMCCGCVLHFS